MIWVIWAINLLVQNWAFTFVSRARSSGSLRRHIVAAIFSNGIWIMQIQILFGGFMDYLTGKHGFVPQILVGLYYTAFTVTGSVLAHYWSLKTEKGKSAVGANDRYVQITKEEWSNLQLSIRNLEREI